MFRDKETGRTTRPKMLTISEMEEYLRGHPEMDTAPSAPGIHSGRGLRKPDQGFRDHLRRIKKAHYKSTVNTFD